MFQGYTSLLDGSLLTASATYMKLWNGELITIVKLQLPFLCFGSEWCGRKHDVFVMFVRPSVRESVRAFGKLLLGLQKVFTLRKHDIKISSRQQATLYTDSCPRLCLLTEDVTEWKQFGTSLNVSCCPRKQRRKRW